MPYCISTTVAKEVVVTKLLLLEPVLGLEHVDKGLAPLPLSLNIGTSYLDVR